MSTQNTSALNERTSAAPPPQSVEEAALRYEEIDAEDLEEAQETEEAVYV